MYKSLPTHYLSHIGRKNERITILEPFLKNGQLCVRFKCDCGEEGSCRFHRLLKECHICASKKIKRYAVTHGLSRSPEYVSWQLMRKRCSNPNDPAYKNYGQRGIKVCDRWNGEHSFVNFLADMGSRPEPKRSYSIDRINNNGDYSPENCRWSLQKDQLKNKRQGDSIYRVHDKVCVECTKEFKGYFKNRYCCYNCQQRAYQKRKRQGLVRTVSPSKTS